MALYIAIYVYILKEFYKNIYKHIIYHKSICVCVCVCICICFCVCICVCVCMCVYVYVFVYVYVYVYVSDIYYHIMITYITTEYIIYDCSIIYVYYLRVVFTSRWHAFHPIKHSVWALVAASGVFDLI